MKNYSQTDEQAVILNYFKGWKGTFLDLGANDGETFSNTRALALSGWKGVLIEPSPKAFNKLKSLYDGHEGVYLYQFAITKQNGSKVLQESGPLCSAADVGLVSTFHDHEKARFAKSVRYTPIEVSGYDWQTFAGVSPFSAFDFISMDIEGSELDVLPYIDLSETKMICIEHNGRKDLKTDYEKYLEGFMLIHTTGENLIYVR
jgi:FkbM family methyltransferase